MGPEPASRLDLKGPAGRNDRIVIISLGIFFQKFSSDFA